MDALLKMKLLWAWVPPCLMGPTLKKMPWLQLELLLGKTQGSHLARCVKKKYKVFIFIILNKLILFYKRDWNLPCVWLARNEMEFTNNEGILVFFNEIGIPFTEP